MLSRTQPGKNGFWPCRETRPSPNRRPPLAEGVLSVSLGLHLLQSTEIQKVVGAVRLVVEGVGVCQLDAVSHALVEPDTLEIVVPAAHVRDHVKAHEPAKRRPCHTSCGMAAFGPEDLCPLYHPGVAKMR
jgi:hypothetical protein